MAQRLCEHSGRRFELGFREGISRACKRDSTAFPAPSGALLFWTFRNSILRELRLAEEYDAAQGRGEVRTRADNQHFADGKKLSADEIGLVGEWNPEDDAYATHALPGNPVVLAPPPSMAALPLGGAGVRDLPRPRGHPRGARLMTDPVQGRHSLECTSPKGRPFRGRCVLCAAEDLR